MRRTIRRNGGPIAIVALVLGLLLFGREAPSGAAVQPPTNLYRITLPARDREARTALVRAGLAIEPGPAGAVTAIVSAAELAELRATGYRVLDVEPLDFPAVDAAYHNYAETIAEIQAVAGAHPDIIRLGTAGQSLEGRAIPFVKISDSPDLDDPAEPSILFMSLTHAREHLTVEMALSIVRLFADGYGVDPALTNLVEQREIWILPNVNPDGGEFDLSEDNYQFWRKNRRPNAGNSVGVDLNRNYDYHWGCCGGSSNWGYSDLFRGTAAFSEPETQVVRDFVLAHPDITTAISFHTYGEFILYPFGYTYTDVPGDMTPQDRSTFVSLAGAMAATNGYTPQQSSDLYIVSGDVGDWLYGARGVFGFTFEMYPDGPDPGFYPSAGVIPVETERNHAAVIYLTGMADNPRKAAGQGGDVTAPQLLLTSPAVAGPVPLGPLALAATAEDAVGVTLVAWQVDGETVAFGRTAPFEASWTPPGPGNYSVRALAFDAGGNSATSPSVVVTAGSPLSRMYLPVIENH